MTSSSSSISPPGAVISTGREANCDGFVDKDAIVVCIWTAVLDRLFEGNELRRKGFKVEDGEVKIKRKGIRIFWDDGTNSSENCILKLVRARDGQPLAVT